jgi:hypothetical protein
MEIAAREWLHVELPTVRPCREPLKPSDNLPASIGW